MGLSHQELDQAVRRGYVAAMRLLRNADEAHDACQEAARKAWSARERYDSNQPFYPWFYRILKNHCLDKLSRRKRKRMAKETLKSHALAEPKMPDAETQLIANERASAIERAIGMLPEEQREIIELRHFQGASYAEISAILDLADGTVMSRLYRARQRMRDILSEDPGFSRKGGMP